jgi:hypothetical protein
MREGVAAVPTPVTAVYRVLEALVVAERAAMEMKLPVAVMARLTPVVEVVEALMFVECLGRVGTREVPGDPE